MPPAPTCSAGSAGAPRRRTRYDAAIAATQNSAECAYLSRKRGELVCEMPNLDEMMARIGEGIGLGERGERTAARQVFAQVWEDLGGESGDPLRRCALAHSMADVQDDMHDELVWDLRALQAADLITEERRHRLGSRATSPGSTPHCTSTSPTAAAGSVSRNELGTARGAARQR